MTAKMDKGETKGFFHLPCCILTCGTSSQLPIGQVVMLWVINTSNTCSMAVVISNSDSIQLPLVQLQHFILHPSYQKNCSGISFFQFGLKQSFDFVRMCLLATDSKPSLCMYAFQCFYLSLFVSFFVMYIFPIDQIIGKLLCNNMGEK